MVQPSTLKGLCALMCGLRNQNPLGYQRQARRCHSCGVQSISNILKGKKLWIYLANLSRSAVTCLGEFHFRGGGYESDSIVILKPLI